MSLFRPWLLILIGLLAGSPGIRAAAPVESVDPRTPGTLRMVMLLDRMAREANPMQNRFMSPDRVRHLQRAMATNPPPDQLLSLQFDLASELLNAGRNGEAFLEFQKFEERLRLRGEPARGKNRINILLNEAVCHLRDGELLNCLSNHTSESCLLPIQGGGIHLWQNGSRQAIPILTNLLTEFPSDLSARWLLNIAHMTVGEYPAGVPAPWLIPPATFASDYDIKRFPEVGAATGLAVRELSGGSVIEDFDGDDLLDVMVTSIGLRDQMHFFHNRGDGTFADRTREAGLIGLTGGLNLITGDFDNDGHVDVLVLRGAWMGEQGRHPNSLLRNRGDGTFDDVTEAAGLLSFHPTQTAVWFDFDGDGWLDLFIGNESVRGAPSHPCELYHNNRNGTFTEMAFAAGVAVRSFVKGVTMADYNNDGRPDLYLSILGRPNLLFRNDGPKAGGTATNFNWTFTEVGAAAGVAMPQYSFPTWFFDYDNDGWEDLFVAGYRIDNVGDVAADYLGLPGHGEHAKLYHNRGDGTFADVTREMGLDHVLHAMGSNYGDLDNDGWLDFYLGTGDPDLVTLIPNRMFRNAAGKRFQDVTTSGGFGLLQKGHGVSFADIDNDGDQDVYENMGGAVSSDVYPNVLFANPGHGNHWVKLQLIGVQANRSAIGARIKVSVTRPNGARTIHRTVSTGGSFGGNPLRQEVGLGDATGIQEVEIRWPGSGTVQKLSGLKMEQCYRIREGSPTPEIVKLRTFALPGPDTHAHSPNHHGP